jgi:putative SOS response-associated peptidase YedK
MHALHIALNPVGIADIGEQIDHFIDGTLETCTILTTKPNSLVAGVHDGMPVILRQEDYDLWLDPGVTNVGLITECLKPFHSGLMKQYPASKLVNCPENDGPECALQPLF